MLVQLEDFDTGATRLASLSAIDPAFTESESGEESCSEEKAVRTPLLVQGSTDAGGLPRYDQHISTSLLKRKFSNKFNPGTSFGNFIGCKCLSRPCLPVWGY